MLGFAIRYRTRGEDLDSWLALGATLTLFAELHYVLTPRVSSDFISQGDFLRLLAYGVLLVGVWRAISFAEFGRAVAEERARVARARSTTGSRSTSSRSRRTRACSSRERRWSRRSRS